MNKTSNLGHLVDQGSVAILNVGDGDTKLSFDPRNPAERIRAARIVRDMLRRGYALLVEVEIDGKKTYQRATDFREDVCEYVIADLDPLAAADADVKEETHVITHTEPGTAAGAGSPTASTQQQEDPRRSGRRKIVQRSVPAEQARAVVVAPVAGG